MTLPSGQISFNEVNVELTRTATAQLEANDTTVRGLANVVTAGSVISMNDLRGKAFVNLVISANTQAYNVYTNAIASPAYSPGVSFVQVTVNPGVIVGSPGPTAFVAMSVPNQFSPTDNVRIVNQGTIVGSGGGGGVGANPVVGGVPGVSGGTAFSTQRSVSINNQGTIAGGGGGGGGGGGYSLTRPPKQGGPINYTGGGGGGGAGSVAGNGGPGGSGAASSGTLTEGGAGAPGAPPYNNSFQSRVYHPGSGGNGGALGNSGVAGQDSVYVPSPVGPPSFPFQPGGPAGSGGNYIVGNPFVTWINNGTRQGGVA